MGINTGILTNAEPLSTEQIQQLDAMVVENDIAVVYLDEEGQLCFAMPRGEHIHGIKDLAWNNAYWLSDKYGILTKKLYKKTGLNTYLFDKTLSKADPWPDWLDGEGYPTPGLYRDGKFICSYDSIDIFGAPGDVVLPSDTIIVEKKNMAFENVARSILIPDGATSIAEQAFWNYFELSEVTIPASVTSIGFKAFYCTDNTRIIYNGTVAQWNAISKNREWQNSGVSIIICTDGIVEP
jgi:hypothetical protein